MALKREAITTLTDAEAGLPLLEWVSRRFSYHSSEVWDTIIAAGRLTVNGALAAADRLTAQGDVVQYFPVTADEPEVSTDYRIVHEETDFLVVDKPPNLPCHPGGSFFNNTLWALLKERYDDVRIINRLDRETSGLVLIARNKETAGVLGKLFADRKMSKEYLVIVEGEFPPVLQADGHLEPDPNSKVRKKRRFDKDGEGEPASTRFECLGSSDGISLVRAFPKTGRFHQIRATLCSLGFPLVGDKIYGPDDAIFLRFVDREMTDRDHERLRLSHQALHAERLSFSLQGRGDLSFHAPLPRDMSDFLLEHGFVTTG